MDAERFFSSVFPRTIAANLEKFALLTGDIAIKIRGGRHWTIHLGNFETPVTEDFQRDAGLRLIFVPTAFKQFLAGTLDVTDALSSRKLTVRGDAQLLEKLGYFLTGDGTPAGLWPPPSPNR